MDSWQRDIPLQAARKELARWQAEVKQVKKGKSRFTLRYVLHRVREAQARLERIGGGKE